MKNTLLLVIGLIAFVVEMVFIGFAIVYFFLVWHISTQFATALINNDFAISQLYDIVGYFMLGFFNVLGIVGLELIGMVIKEVINE